MVPFSGKPPGRFLPSSHVKAKVVYASKASYFVLSPQARMNFTQFCALLMTIDKQSKKNKDSTYSEPQQKLNLKTKGSLISGPFVFNYFPIIYRKQVVP